MSVLIDTGILVDYLLGDRRALHAVESHAHRSISALTWLETMAMSPADRHESTRAFLRSFERLSINEAIADEAFRLTELHPGLPLDRALNWATARANRLVFVCASFDGLPQTDPSVSVLYD